MLQLCVRKRVKSSVPRKRAEEVLLTAVLKTEETRFISVPRERAEVITLLILILQKGTEETPLNMVLQKRTKGVMLVKSILVVDESVQVT